MKILIVSQYFWPESFRINDLAAGLVERGHQITVLTGIPNYPDGHFFSGYGFFRNMRQNYLGVNVIRVPLVPRGKGGGIQLALNYLSFAFFSSILAPFFCTGKYDVIFCYQLSPVTVGLPAIVVKKLKKVPLLFWVQDLWPESLSATGAITSEKKLMCVRKLVRFIYRYCDRILIQSLSFSSFIEKEGVNAERILYFPNSVEKSYKPVSRQSNFAGKELLPTGFRIMFAGNIGAAQDLGTILSAAKKLEHYTDIQWVILGDGRMRHWVETEINSRGLSKSVHLLGRYSMQAMPYFFSAADVMIVTLKREPVFALTIPSKIQSYMACGRPIIAALDGEGGQMVVDSGAGFAVPAEDSDGLTNAVLKMYRMPKEEREEMGNRGKEYCEVHFEREMLLDKLEGWMQAIIAD